MEGLANAAADLFQPVPFCLMILGTVLGVMVGAIPGLTGAMLIALTLPLTFSMHYADALNALRQLDACGHRISHREGSG